MGGLRKKGESRGMPEAACGGGGSDGSPITVASGNRAIPVRSHRAGVTSDEAEDAPRLRVTYGEDSRESTPPLKHRVEAHTASAQDSSTPVPERWRSRGARIRGSHRRRIELPGVESSRRYRPTRTTALRYRVSAPGAAARQPRPRPKTIATATPTTPPP